MWAWLGYLERRWRDRLEGSWRAGGQGEGSVSFWGGCGEGVVDLEGKERCG